MSDILQWLNLLLVPTVGLLFSINGRIATLEANQGALARRLEKLDGIKA
jgi:hypothetical protein